MVTYTCKHSTCKAEKSEVKGSLNCTVRQQTSMYIHMHHQQMQLRIKLTPSLYLLHHGNPNPNETIKNELRNETLSSFPKVYITLPFFTSLFLTF